MTQKRVKASDVIGNSYYIYTLESSNNTPALNGTINITCNVTNVYGQAVSGKSITLYQNNTSKGAKTTDSNGNASWNSISMSSAGLQTFKVENSKIEIFVDNKADVGHTHSQYLTEHQSLSNYVTTDDSRLSDSRTPTSHTHGNLQNNGQVGSTAQANKNVVTNSSGLITTEDKPTIPSASSTTPSADTTSGSVGSGTTWARSNHTHPKSSLYAEATHNHTKSQITDFPSIPSKTSDLQNDSGFLTSHQSLSGYLQTSDVKDNLTSTDTNKPLSANQGKELKALVDNKEDNIYRIVGTGTSTYSNRVRLDCGTFPFDSANGKILVYVVPNISSLSESLVVDLLGAYPSGVSTAFPMRKSNDTTLTIGEIQTGDELLLFYESSAWRLIGNSSISGKEDKSNKVSSWSSTTTDNHYPSEKLVKDSLDGKLDKTHTSYKGKNVVTNASTGAIEFEDKNNHTHSNYLTSNDISGKIDTAGTGLSKSGTTLNHSNSVTALTTASFKKVKYDSQGHITGTSDVSASDLPSHNHTKSQITDFPTIPSKTSDLTNDSGFLTFEDGAIYIEGTNATTETTTNTFKGTTSKLSHTNLPDGTKIIYKVSVTSTNNTNDLRLQLSIGGIVETYIKINNKFTTANLYPQNTLLFLVRWNGVWNIVGTSTLENSNNKVSSWSSTPTDINYPSEKLVKDSLDSKIDTNLTYATATGNNDEILCRTYDDGKIHRTQAILTNWIKNPIALTGTGGIGSASGDGQSSINTKINNALVNLTANKEDKIYRIVGTEVSSPSSSSARLHCGTLPFDNISGKIFVYVVPNISSLSTSQKALIYGTYPSGSSISYNIFKSNNEYLTIGDIQTGDELLLMDEGDVRVISNSSISGKEDSSNKVSSWNSTTNNIRYPTEKLVKDSLDGKANSTHTHTSSQISDLIDVIYPIGSIYMSVNSTSPQTLFGGTWEQIKDTFLLASGDTYANGTTGGSADAVVVSHNHATNTSGEYFVTSESSEANNTRVTYSSSGNRYVDGMTSNSTPFHHRVGTGYVGSSGTGKNMPPYLAVYVWKRTA